MLKTSIMVKDLNGCAEQFKLVRSLGYEAVDYQNFATEPGQGLFALSDSEFEDFLRRDKAAAAEAGVIIHQTHGVWPYDDTKPEQKQPKYDAMVRSIIGTSILGAKYVVIHPVLPHMWAKSDDHAADVAENREYVRGLTRIAEQYGVTIALENMPNADVPCGRIEELCDCIDAIDSPNLKACLDIGHATVLGYDAGDAVRLLGDRLAVVHIHDNDGRRDLHMLPFSGVTKWPSFAKGLKDIGYSGTLSMETAVSYKLGQLPRELVLEGEAWIAKVMKHFAQMVEEA